MSPTRGMTLLFANSAKRGPRNAKGRHVDRQPKPFEASNKIGKLFLRADKKQTHVFGRLGGMKRAGVVRL
jgi:hypothetical protein